MADVSEFREKIAKILSQDYKVTFLGENFNQIVSLLTESKSSKIYTWVEGVVNRKIQPIVIGSKKKYKKYSLSELLTFRYAFVISNTEYRILLVKVKNAIYIEFHLGDHKYYDKVRRDLT